MDAAAKVRKAPVSFGAAVDRSGHRLDGFLQSYGGGFFTRTEGRPHQQSGDQEGRRGVRQVSQGRTMPLDIWAGGTGYVGANQQFVKRPAGLLSLRELAGGPVQ